MAKCYTPVKLGAKTNLVILKDGRRANNKQEQAAAFAQHFADGFGGALRPVLELATESRFGAPGSFGEESVRAERC